MYIFNRRYNDVIDISASGSSGSTRYNVGYGVPRFVEGVYSWRTGSGKESDPPASPTTSTHDGWGIKTPQTSGSLVDKLSSRKNYIEEVQRAAFPAETHSGSISTDRTSKTDNGHLFATVKLRRYPLTGRLTYDRYPGRPNLGLKFDGIVAQGVGGRMINPSPHAFGFPAEDRSANGLSNTDRQGLYNNFFMQTAPDRKDASLGVTLAELARGDLPSVLKNFRKMMDEVQSIKKTLGSDYLNVVFGWTPLINELFNVIKVGMTIDRAVYYESFRRSRQWDGPSVSDRSDVPIQMSTNPTYHAHTFPTYGNANAWGGAGVVGGTLNQRTTTSENYRFNSRYTGIAKPTLAANRHNEKAMDVISRLGLVDDPQILWELTPYSWLVDWFTTMGASISNARTYSGISNGKYSIDYAYVTTQFLKDQLAVPVKVDLDSAGSKEFRLTSSNSYSNINVKWRNRATPFGFGTQLGSLSSSQYAILVALGLAKSR